MQQEKNGCLADVYSSDFISTPAAWALFVTNFKVNMNMTTAHNSPNPHVDRTLLQNRCVHLVYVNQLIFYFKTLHRLNRRTLCCCCYFCWPRLFFETWEFHNNLLLPARVIWRFSYGHSQPFHLDCRRARVHACACVSKNQGRAKGFGEGNGVNSVCTEASSGVPRATGPPPQFPWDAKLLPHFHIYVAPVHTKFKSTSYYLVC